jgi:hypothetical protein
MRRTVHLLINVRTLVLHSPPQVANLYIYKYTTDRITVPVKPQILHHNHKRFQLISSNKQRSSHKSLWLSMITCGSHIGNNSLTQHRPTNNISQIGTTLLQAGNGGKLVLYTNDGRCRIILQEAPANSPAVHAPRIDPAICLLTELAGTNQIEGEAVNKTSSRLCGSTNLVLDSQLAA